ncbi:unnamed protein product [Ceutorhynchus assimilis]|uniref:Bax inhibitor 1 n=1 Tax=Ceutorhynchus assimilis TaxID=467358 RepID=A0A9N9QQH3_9CUCU|nr:unnamed protein product [Ceutorhynchus assimilis]
MMINSLNNRLEPSIKHYLRNVYASLVMSNLAAAVGASIHLFTNISSAGGSVLLVLSTIAEMLLFFVLILSPDHDGISTAKRLGYLLGFSILSGFNLGPLLRAALMIDPSILVNAFLAASGVFFSFTICALFSETGEWMFLGGVLITFWEALIVVSLANIIFGSTLLWEVDVYLKLFILCAFILYETQAIIEQRRMGNKDVAAHSLYLFVSVFGIFRNILIILNQETTQAIRRTNTEGSEENN